MSIFFGKEPTECEKGGLGKAGRCELERWEFRRMCESSGRIPRGRVKALGEVLRNIREGGLLERKGGT